jgi:hypothetical protein
MLMIVSGDDSLASTEGNEAADVKTKRIFVTGNVPTCISSQLLFIHHFCALSLKLRMLSQSELFALFDI